MVGTGLVLLLHGTVTPSKYKRPRSMQSSDPTSLYPTERKAPHCSTSALPLSDHDSEESATGSILEMGRWRRDKVGHRCTRKSYLALKGRRNSCDLQHGQK